MSALKKIVLLSTQRTGSSYVGHFLGVNGIDFFGEFYHTKWSDGGGKGEWDDVVALLDKSVGDGFIYRTVSEDYHKKERERRRGLNLPRTSPGERLPLTGKGENHSLIKVMCNQLSVSEIKQVVDHCDFAIINYRKNVLRSYASALAARLSSHGNVETTNIKVRFRKPSFEKWMNEAIQSARLFKEVVKNKKDVSYVCYEKLHRLSGRDKLDYILPPEWNLIKANSEVKEPDFKQQNKNLNIYNSFRNGGVARKHTRNLDINKLWSFLE